MNESNGKAIERHVRGATVVHVSPFSSLAVPSANDVLSLEECEKFVEPFYRVSFQGVDGNFIAALGAVYREISPRTVELLLTEYNWRPRLTGAFFATLKRLNSFEDHIGRLLLRSDLCFAGTLYCAALAEFNSLGSLNYLKQYLEYYLTRPDLDYNQGDAMGAIAYLDARNGTKVFSDFLPRWEHHVKAKSWKPNLEISVAGFADEMEAIHDLRNRVEAGLS